MITPCVARATTKARPRDRSLVRSVVTTAVDLHRLHAASAGPDRRHYGKLGAAFSGLSLVRKVALIPALTLLLMGLLLAFAVQMGQRNTMVLRAMDREVFEPLSRAQTLKDEITLLHTRLFALLSNGTNESDPAAEKAGADAIIAQLNVVAANVVGFIDIRGTVLPPVAAQMRRDFAAYAAKVRDTAGFAAYDASYGALLAGGADEDFGRLHADLDALVQALAQRRVALVKAAVGNSLNAQQLLLGLGLGATALALLGSAIVGRGIARPVLRLTGLMNQLAGGDTDLIVPGTDRQDEVGAMARAVEVFRANAIARRQGEAKLRRTNLQFDAALNSMLQGMVVWGADCRVQLVNDRYFAICDMPKGSIEPNMSVSEVVESCVRHGLYPEDDPKQVADGITALLTARQSTQFEMAMRPGLIVRITREPMANGGAVVTFEDVTEKRHNEERIAFMAGHDALTGLPNRTMFQEHAEAAVARLGTGHQFAVLCLDLDRFKDVNDTLGHAVGDELLRLVAGRLRHCVRDLDVVARLGGDEFAVVLASGEASGGAMARLGAGDLARDAAVGLDRRALSRCKDTMSLSAQVSASRCSRRGVPVADLLKRADLALYRAKEERGTFVFFEPGMDKHLQARRGMEADLRLAIQREEFELYYQPLYNLAEDRVTGFEALVRWNSPTRGRISPADFIPLAEHTGLIGPIGAWVLRTACAEAASWPDQVHVAVNLSPVQFKNQRLVAMVRETLEATGLSAQRLELEITEAVLLQDTELVMTILRSLHDLGVRVSMDDFGTGYSSLSYLRRFPFDKIKIDRSFVADLLIAPGNAEAVTAVSGASTTAAKSAAMIVRAITGLGRSLGISTTAEGVETAEQLAQIRQEGCTEAQGYFISPPRPAAEVVALLRRLDATMPVIAGRRHAAPLRLA